MNRFAYGIRSTFNYQGRAGRSEFGWFILFYIMSAWVVSFIGLLFFGLRLLEASSFVYRLNDFLDFILLLPIFSVTARRLHDLGYSGWWQGFLASVNVLMLFSEDVAGLFRTYQQAEQIMLMALAIYFIQLVWLLVKKGQPFDNRYGKALGS